jgi:hypothetical protein
MNSVITENVTSYVSSVSQSEIGITSTGTRSEGKALSVIQDNKHGRNGRNLGGTEIVKLEKGANSVLNSFQDTLIGSLV